MSNNLVKLCVCVCACVNIVLIFLSLCIHIVAFTVIVLERSMIIPTGRYDFPVDSGRFVLSFSPYRVIMADLL